MQKLKKRFVKRVVVPVGYSVRRGVVSEELNVFIPINRFGVGLVCARSRSGKSSIAKVIAAVVSHSNRRVMIIDPYSEYHKCVHPNFKAKPLSVGFKNFEVIKNFAFKLTDFWVEDWASLGFSYDAAYILAQYAHCYEIHQNHFEVFANIVFDTPSTDKQLDKFNNKYGEHGLVLKGAPHWATVGQMKSKIMRYGDLFKKNKDGKQYIPNFGHILMAGNIIIDLSLRKGVDMEKAAAYVGIILRQVSPYLKFIRPLVIFDESDLFGPMPIEGRPDSSACEYLKEYTIKLQREDVAIIYITQDFSLMHPVLVNNWHWKVLGILDPMSRDYEYVKGLRNEFDSTPLGYREFVYLNANNRYVRFVPIEVPTNI